MSRKLTTPEFIDRANKVHQGLYEYSQVDYMTTKAPVKIICKKHGSFLQSPANHLQGNGCPECGKEKIRKSLKNSKVAFIERANKIHNNFYNYSESNYGGMHLKCLIRCPIHGPFYQTPANHIFSKQGCPECGALKKQQSNATRKKTNKTFTVQSSKKHNSKYDYSRVNYINNSTPVEITCPIHGNFLQLPTNHLNLGHGCPKCAQYGFNPSKPATLYYLKDKETGLYKVGITNKSLEDRFGKDFSSKRINILLEETYEDGQKAYLAEQEILTAFNNYRCVNDNWPEDKGGKTEFFNKDILKKDKS